MVDELHILLKKYKHKTLSNHKNINTYLDIYDASLFTIPPESNIFKNEPNKLAGIDRKLIKSHFKIKSCDNFYKTGLIENTIFNKNVSACEKFDEFDTDINDATDSAIAHNKQLKQLKKFSKAICTHNWLLSFNIWLHFSGYQKLDFIKTHDIQLLNIGNGNMSFISGMYYYFTSYKYGQSGQNLDKFNISWMCVDISNDVTTSKFRNINTFITKNIPQEQFHIVHGFATDDIFDFKTLSIIKAMVANKMGKANIIYNNIKPRIKYPTNKIMLIMAILSSYSLSTNGLLVTKILEPEYWGGAFINYIILLASLFNKTEIFRFPVCKNGISYFRYYMACCYKKSLVYNNTLGSKLLYMFNNDEIEQPQLIDDILGCDSIKAYIQKIKDIQKIYTVITNPNEALHNNIASLNRL